MTGTAASPLASPSRYTNELSVADVRRVIFASSLGTVFEWYDFYLYGSLAAIISKQFFSGVNPTAAFIFALLAFAAGFAVRPFGALVFGRLGDLVGRKYTFLITILIMGMSTFIVGVLPSYARIGIAAPVILILLRLLQGLALGGEYGGAATYVAEHAPAGKRGAYTSWIQTTATLGLFLSLLVILGCRLWLGTEQFEAWGWRIPFLVSLVLLAVSVWIRLKLNESPLFQAMKAEGKTSKAPLTESFAEWGNLKIVLLALFGLTAGQAVVWYTGQFYTLFFLTQTLKVDAQTANLLIAASLLLATPFFLVFGSLSDRIGRKPIIMAGLLLAALTYFPLFRAITHYANPGARGGAGARAGDGDGGSERLLGAVQSGGDVEVHVAVRRGEGGAGEARRAVLERTAASAAQSTGCALIIDGDDHVGSTDDPVVRRHRARREGAGRGVRQGARRRADDGGLSRQGRARADQQADGDAAALDPRHLRDDGLRPDRGDARRDVPDAHPLHVDVTAVSHRQRLVRRLPAVHRLRDRRGDGEHLLGPLVPDRHRRDHARHRHAVRARDEGRGYWA